MGLAGRKVKQRIGPDPRNLAWVDDASKFGASYLAKFGWDSSKGLGVEGQGRTTHIKVSQKLDMLGIGAAQSQDPHGIAWKQNQDFESLLKRLNEDAPASAAQTGTTGDGERGAVSDIDIDINEQKESKEDKKKRKREEKQAKKEKKERHKRKRDEGDDEEVEQQKSKKKMKEEEEVKEKAEKVEQPKRVVPRHRAHRARAIAAKDISSKSAVHIAEILGIASSSSSTTSTTAVTPSGTLTPLDQDVFGFEKLTTSTKSVADYFKERLLAKTGKSSPLSSVVTPKSGSSEGTVNNKDGKEDAPRGGLGPYRNSKGDDLDDVYRGGLGSASRTTTTSTSAASSFQMGLPKSRSILESATTTTKEEVMVEDGAGVDDIDGDEDSTAEDIETREKNKRKKGKKLVKKIHNEVAEVAGKSDAVNIDERIAKEKKKAKDKRRREKAEKKERKIRKREELERPA